MVSQEIIESARKELARRELARRHLEHFVQKVYQGQYLMGWVHKLICAELDQFYDDVVNKKSPRLIITMPPRSGKSELFSRMFPAFALGKNPDLKFIACSYSPALACHMNRDVQRIIDSDPYKVIFPKSFLNSKRVVADSRGAYTRNTTEFEMVGRKGAYLCAGSGTPINGMGADIFLIDDPFKDRASAESTVLREHIHDWFTSTAYTRLAPTGGMIIGNTRWHVDDLSGRLIEKMKVGGETYKVINFPAIAEEDEYFNGKLLRHTGEALHPERYPLARLNVIKNTVGERDWNSLYQQHPILNGGNLFKGDWLRYYTPSDLPSSFDSMLMSWDLTFHGDATADFVAGSVWGKKDARYFLLDLVNERMDFVHTLDAIEAMAIKWPGCTNKLIEDKANGSAAINILKNKLSGIIPVNPKGGKTERAERILPLFRAGNVYLPMPQIRPIISLYVSQLTQFPSSKQDDMVDSTTQALEHWNQQSVTWGSLYG